MAKTKKSKPEREIALVVSETEAREVRRGLGLRKSELEKEVGKMEGLGIPTADAQQMLGVFVGNGKGSGLLARFEVAPDGQGDLLAVEPSGVMTLLGNEGDKGNTVEGILELLRTASHHAMPVDGEKLVDAEGRMFAATTFVHVTYEFLGVRCAWDRDGGGCGEVIADDRGKLCFQHRRVVWDDDLAKLEAQKIRDRIKELEQYVEDADNETAEELGRGQLKRYEARLAELESSDAEPEAETELTFADATERLGLSFSTAGAIIAKDRLPIPELLRLKGRGTGQGGKLTKADVEKVIGMWVAETSKGPEAVH